MADGAVERLLEWAKNQGALLPLLRAQGRALLLTAGASAGEALIQLPQRLLLTSRAPCGAVDSLPSALEALHREGATDWTLLVLRLCVERALGAASFWAAYIEALPSAYTDPLWWSDAQLAGLRNLPLAPAVAAQAEALAELRQRWAPRLLALLSASPSGCGDAVAAALRDEGGGCGSSLLWARSSVATRAFTLSPPGCEEGHDGAAAVAALLPVADLLDHDAESGCGWAFPRSGGPGSLLAVSSPLPLPAGAEPSMSYGVRSNAQLLLTFGFSLHPNPADAFSVSLGAEGGLGDRRAALRRLGLSTRASLAPGDPLPARVLGAMRVLLASEQDLYDDAGDGGDGGDGGDSAAGSRFRSPGCALLEARVVAALRRALAAALAPLGASAGDDEAALGPAGCAAAGARRPPRPAAGAAAARGCGGARNEVAHALDGTRPGQAGAWGCGDPAWALAAYRSGQRGVLRASLAALGRHAADALLPRAPAGAGVDEEEEGGENDGGASAPLTADEEVYADWLDGAGVVYPLLTRASVAASATLSPANGWRPTAPLRLRAAASPGDVLAFVPEAVLLRAVGARAAAAAAGEGGGGPAAPLADGGASLAAALLRERAAGPSSRLAPLLARLGAAPPPAAAVLACAAAAPGTTLVGAAEAEAEAGAEAGGNEADPGARGWAAACARLCCPAALPALAPLLHALLPALGSLVDAVDRGGAGGGVALVAAAPLAAGAALRLRRAGGRAHAADALLGDGCPADALHPGPGAHAFELCLAPRPGPQAALQAAALAALRADGSHWLAFPPAAAAAPGPPAAPCRLLAAVRVCAAGLGPPGGPVEAAARAAASVQSDVADAQAAADALDGACVYVSPGERAAAGAALAAAAARAGAAAGSLRAALLGPPRSRARAAADTAGLLADVLAELSGGGKDGEEGEDGEEGGEGEEKEEAGEGGAAQQSLSPALASWADAVLAHGAAQKSIVGAWLERASAWRAAAEAEEAAAADAASKRRRA